ncbi:acyl-CoA synthetase family protein isoform X2 [Tasmannia lanceolata]
MLSLKLLRAVLKVATSTSCYQSVSPSSTRVYEKSSNKRNNIFLKLHSFLPEETLGITRETPLRLLFWYLDPLTLKHDISRILEETVQRPFLFLKKELHERMAWRSIIICLVTSPAAFMEARALFHNWFLVTGLASILELCTGIVSSALDALSRPMSWGLSMELGLKLPFSHAYFPSTLHKLLVKLTGPLSCESFLDLVHLVMGPVAKTKKHVDPIHTSYDIFRKTAAKATIVDHKSTWGMLMDFPAWFYFAAMLLFCGERGDIYPLKCKPGAIETEGTDDVQLHYAAARYLAWILSPINENHSDILLGCVTEISSSWTLKHKEAAQSRSCSNTCNNNTVGRWTKLKKLKSEEENTKEHIVLGVEHWLKDFHGCYVKYYNKIETTHVGSSVPNLLFRRILLGILIGCSRYLDEKGYDLLLHYAATGEILGLREAHYTRMKNVKLKSRGCDSEDWTKVSEERDERKGFIAGASLVFDLFDTIEDMSVSMFECEDNQRDFICWGKGKAGKYLVKCIKKLLELRSDEDEGRLVMLMDLNRRLARWMHQGREIFEGCEAFNNVFSDLNRTISSLHNKQV